MESRGDQDEIEDDGRMLRNELMIRVSMKKIHKM